MKSSGIHRQVKSDTVDPVWDRVRQEAELVVHDEPALAGFIMSSILNHETLEAAIAHRIANRIGHGPMPADMIVHTYMMMVEDQPSISLDIRADITAVVERDPACNRFIEPVLYFKGFHAIQTHRLAHWLWGKGRIDFALYLQSLSSQVFQTDINPAASIGRGIFLDHATGVVVGATAVIGDNVSILQNVTLGGTGKEKGDRHPKIGSGVLIGAGAKVLGNITVGKCARIAAGSVVLTAVPNNTTVAGVPARVIGVAGCAEPALSMDQLLASLESSSL
ncbi:serine O-acetyltransferase [Microvirga sp. W0021]|uniref:Serine acetyltransferase n=2 Tax=Hohaiivirga grylli TaxID=3133970 RepID=A0ABV0BLD4_9HYPH